MLDQAIRLGNSVGFVLAFYPPGIDVTSRWFVGRPEPTHFIEHFRNASNR